MVPTKYLFLYYAMKHKQYLSSKYNILLKWQAGVYLIQWHNQDLSKGKYIRGNWLKSGWPWLKSFCVYIHNYTNIPVHIICGTLQSVRRHTDLSGIFLNFKAWEDQK